MEQVPLNGAQDLDALDDYLMSDLAPYDSMGLSDLDGFLTGTVVVTKSQIHPERDFLWLLLLFPVFGSSP